MCRTSRESQGQYTGTALILKKQAKEEKPKERKQKKWSVKERGNKDSITEGKNLSESILEQNIASSLHCCGYKWDRYKNHNLKSITKL